MQWRQQSLFTARGSVNWHSHYRDQHGGFLKNYGLSFVPAFPFVFEGLSLKGQNYTWVSLLTCVFLEVLAHFGSCDAKGSRATAYFFPQTVGAHQDVPLLPLPWGVPGFSVPYTASLFCMSPLFLGITLQTLVNRTHFISGEVWLICR